MASPALVVRHVLVFGRVHGVGFRAFVDDQSIALGLAGWVRNRRDGSVEAVFAGPADKVAQAIEACRRGPPASRVDRCVVTEAALDLVGGNRAGFLVLPTA